LFVIGIKGKLVKPAHLWVTFADASIIMY